MTIQVKTIKASKKAKDIDKYWTAKRIKAAKALPYKPPQTEQKPKQEKSSDNKGKSGQSTQKHNKSSTGTVQTATSGYSNAQPVTNPQQYPWRCVGKLLFTMDGNNYDASAAAFGDNVILTAAHNLYDVDEKQRAENVVFIPAYTNGEEPFGRWIYSSYTLPQAWEDGKGDAYDYATITLKKGGKDNKSIGDGVGYLGFITQLPFQQEWTDVGYPAAISEGEVMIQEPGEFTRTQEEEGIMVGKKGSMGDGASGGPWLLDYEMSLRINGVHSFEDDRYPDEVFSAYFGEEVAEFLHLTKS